MKLRLLLLLAAALAAAPAAGQTIKSLGYNTTNGNIVAATNVTFTNSVGFATNARATTRTNLGLGGSDSVTFSNLSLSGNGSLAIGGMNLTAISSGIDLAFKRAGSTELELKTNGLILHTGSYAFSGGNSNGASTTRTNLGLGAAWLTNTNVTNFRTAIGLGGADAASFDSLTIGAASGDPLNVDYYQIESPNSSFLFNWEERRLTQGSNNIFTWSSTNAAFPVPVSFSTNVSIAGSLSVGSFTTTTPSTWALDATQTAAATNGRLTLPSNANVIRLTNNNAISSVTNGVLGAFYYLVNQATNAVTISNVGGITIDGAQNLTLSPNESATLVATGPTNVSVANRGDLTDVALGGTANTAPSQTASSASSLMTRELNDFRLFGMLAFYDPRRPDIGTVTLTNGAVNDYYASLAQREMQTGTNPAGAAVFTSGYSVKNSGAQNLNWAGRVVVSWQFRRLVNTTSEVRLQFGRDAFASTHAALTARGVGIRITQTNMFFETHNGTTGFETTNSVALPSNDEIFWVDVQSGVARFYRNHDTLLATVTNNVPFNNDPSSNEGGWTVSISNTSTNNSLLTLLQNPGFVLQQ